MPVTVSCRVLQVDRREYYRWLKKPLSDREVSDQELLKHIQELHAAHPGDRYRLLRDGLADEKNIHVSKNRVHRLCKQEKIWAHFAGKTPRKNMLLSLSRVMI